MMLPHNGICSASNINSLLPGYLDIRGDVKVVPGGGVEPPRAEARRILSPLRMIADRRMAAHAGQLFREDSALCSNEHGLISGCLKVAAHAISRNLWDG